jgi:PAS domain S-box-containing protein
VKRIEETKTHSKLTNPDYLKTPNISDNPLLSRKTQKAGTSISVRKKTQPGPKGPDAMKPVEIDAKIDKLFQEKWMAAFDALPDLISVLDNEQRIIKVNKAMAEKLGKNYQHCLGDKCYHVIHNTTSPPGFCPHTKMILEGIQQSAEIYEDRVGASLLVTVTPLKDAQNRILGSIHVARNITELRRTELALAKSENRFRTLFESSHDAIMTIEPPLWNFTSGNQATLQMFMAQDEKEFLSHEPWTLSPEQQPDGRVSSEKAKEMIEIAIRNGSHTFEWTHKRLNGEEFPATVLLTRMELAGKILVQATVRDDTEHKRTDDALRTAYEKLEKANQELAKASQIKSLFLANMSHEIRTPLNAIIGMTGLLLETDLNEQQQDFVETVHTSGDVLMNLINDILDYSKIEAQKVVLEHQPFELRRCIEEALDLVAAKASKKKLELAYFINENLPAFYIGDTTRLRQTVLNLLSNAAKFTESGEVVLSVIGQRIKKDLYELHFSVKDTGIGISPDQQNQLFQSFGQLDASTTRQFGGTGLGLAISKRLSELMGGKIWAESAGIPGQGSTFHFTIQVQAVADQTISQQHELVDLAGKKVLIVDDNKTNRRILSHYAESWKMTPTAVDSGQLALDLLEQKKLFDLAILDLQMPGMDGLALAKEMKKRLKDRTFPFILLHSYGDLEMDNHEVQFAAYLTKPIKPSLLFDTLIASLSSQPKKVKKKIKTTPIPLDRDMGLHIPLRILIVEDNAMNQKVALSLLNRIGYVADVAANGKEALEVLHRQQYDVILMDGQMPEMDGEEATRHIRQQWPKDQQPFIIAMTANALQGDRERYLAAGMDDYISKPIRIEELARSLGNTRPVAGQKSEALPSSVIRNQRAKKVNQSDAVDPNVLKEFQNLMGENGRHMVAELVEIYLQDSPALITQIQKQITARDFDTLRRAAHTLKGNSNQIGAMTLADLSAKFEEMAKAGSLKDAKIMLDKLQSEFNRVNIELKKFLI